MGTQKQKSGKSGISSRPTVLNGPVNQRGAARSRSTKRNDDAEPGAFGRFMQSESVGAQVAKSFIAIFGGLSYLFGINWGLSHTSLGDGAQDAILAGSGAVAATGFGIARMPRASLAFGAAPISVATIRATTRWSAERAAQRLLDEATAQARAGQPAAAAPAQPPAAPAPAAPAATPPAQGVAPAGLPQPAANAWWNGAGYAEMPTVGANVARQPAYPMPTGALG